MILIAAASVMASHAPRAPTSPRGHEFVEAQIDPRPGPSRIIIAKQTAPPEGPEGSAIIRADIDKIKILYGISRGWRTTAHTWSTTSRTDLRGRRCLDARDYRVFAIQHG
jgi:hypothetical protein